MRAEKETHRTGVAVIDMGEERIRNDQTAEERPDESRDSRGKVESASLFEKNKAEQFRARWLEIQSHFVDDPNVSVKDADELVTNVIRNITSTFADKRISLESQWKRGDKVSTEDLRVALRHYRSFFNRLLSLES
jgi:Fic family protein